MSSVTEQIKERLDIVNYIQQVVPSLKKAGRTYKACCPFHGEKSPSFVVNPDSQTWRCYGACAEGGDLFNFVMKYKGLSFADALKELAEQAGVELKAKSPHAKQEDEKLERLRGLLQTAAEYYHQHLRSDDPASQAALQYTRDQRGFTDTTIDEFLIGYAPDGWSAMLEALKKLGHTEAEILEAGLASQNERGNVYDRFRNRLMIPIRDERGRVTGFGARALNPDDTPKYLNSPQSALFDKSRTLFGLDKAKRTIQDSATAVIVEGYMDAIQAHQAGYTNVIAQMGTALTEAQLKLIVPRYAKKIILALDADAAGQKATRRSLEVARETLQADYAGKMGVDIRILHIDDAKDPDDVLRETPEKWAEYVAHAKPVADFVIEMETVNLNAHATIQERQVVARNVLPILLASEDNLYKRDNLQKLALRLRLSEGDLMAWADEFRRKQRPTAKSSRPSEPPKAAVTSMPEPPPLPDDMLVGSGEEPPPYFPTDDDAPPSAYEDYDIAPDLALRPLRKPAANPQRAASPLPGFQMRHASREAERYCLRVLLSKPTLLYQVNRKLRELRDHLTTDVESDLPVPLCELMDDDFSQSDYRALFALLLQAMGQFDNEPMDYILQHLDLTLADELQLILLDEQEVINQRVAGRWLGEQIDVKKKHDKQIRPGMDTSADFLRRILDVRVNRLKREQHDLMFLLVDTEPDQQYQYHQRVNSIAKALNMLQNELQMQSQLS